MAIGPISLIQGDKTYVKESFIVRLAIEMPGYIASVPRKEGPNEIYDKWGFATAIIDLEKAKEKQVFMKASKGREWSFPSLVVI